MIVRQLRASLESFSLSVAVTALAVGLSICVIVAAGYSPADAVRAFWQGAFSAPGSFNGTLEAMVPLTLVAVGWIVAFSTQKINIGFEGQITVGALGAAVVGIALGAAPHAVDLPLLLVVGAGAGAFWAGIAAAIALRHQGSELIATFMLNFVAALLVSYLVRGPLQEPSHMLQQTSPLPAGARWPLMPGAAVSWDIMLIPLAIGALAFLLRRTATGFRLRAIMANPTAASRAGFGTVRLGALALIASGALAGIAGSTMLMASPTGVLQDNFSAGFGFDGIAVALLARNSPLACLPAALVFAALRTGSSFVSVLVNVPTTITQFVEGIVILLLTASVVLLRRQRRRRAGFAPVADMPAPEPVA